MRFLVRKIYSRELEAASKADALTAYVMDKGKFLETTLEVEEVKESNKEEVK